MMTEPPENILYNTDTLSTDHFNLASLLSSGSAAEDNFFAADPDSPYDINQFDCKYIGVDDIQPMENNLCFISINIQSIQAKFTEFKDLIKSLGERAVSPEFILLQEIWRFPDLVDFKLEGYQNLFYRQRTKAQGGGIGIYVKKGINFTIDNMATVFHERIYETLVGTAIINNKKK